MGILWRSGGSAGSLRVMMMDNPQIRPNTLGHTSKQTYALACFPICSFVRAKTKEGVWANDDDSR